MDIAVGQKATRILTLTAAHVKTFVELTGDYNPLYAEVLPVHPTKPVTQLKITVKRQDGETVLEGEAWCYSFCWAMRLSISKKDFLSPNPS